MSRINFSYESEVVTLSEETFVTILSKYNRNLDNVNEDIVIIKDWLKLQKHILIETTDKEILYFLTTCKFSIEKTKEKLNMYYCIRNMLPEYYKNVKPSLKEIQDIINVNSIIFLPNLTPELNRLVIYTIDGKLASIFTSDVVNSYLALMLDVQPIWDMCLSTEFILDFSYLTLDIVLKYSIMDIKKMLTVFEKVYSSRIARVHIVNLPGYCNTFLTVAKAFLKNKIKNRLLMHKGYEPLYKYIPRAMLPSDFGGEANSIAEFKTRIMKKMLECDDHFEKLNGDSIVDENLRPKELLNDEILGFHGSFRKLQVD